jgi:5-methylcytosine-specific restriction enzyme subunit McrC
MDEPLRIQAKDCLAFPKLHDQGIIPYFMEQQSQNVFWFSPSNNRNEPAELANYDYVNHCWVAGRYVGEATFIYEGKTYQIAIKPRFGEQVLFRMLEEIFNIRITQSLTDHTRSDNYPAFIRRVIAFIWVQKLANANLHGLPKKMIKTEHRGHSIRGVLSVRKSIRPYYQSQQLVSVSREKIIDDTIAQIIYQAVHIVRQEFKGLINNFPDAAEDAINQILLQVKAKRTVTEREYRAIQYKEIYFSWKPIVDFSWDLIQRKQISFQQQNSKKGIGFFIDMAEIWEQYIRSLLKKTLRLTGWRPASTILIAYPGRFFERVLIPDLIFERDGQYLIWDAKYKMMRGRSIDVDRSDFFQIHTYLQYYSLRKEVIAGGLIYPLSEYLKDARSYSPYLLHEEQRETAFFIDGVHFEENADKASIDQSETAFTERITNRLMQLLLSVA